MLKIFIWFCLVGAIPPAIAWPWTRELKACTWTVNDGNRDRCFSYEYQAQNFDAAEAQCKRLYGGHLAAADLAVVDQFLRLKMFEVEGSAPNGHTWIGLAMNASNAWNWTDDEITEDWSKGHSDNYTSPAWNPGEPSGDGRCVELKGNRSWMWNDYDCSYVINSICECPSC